MGYFLGPILLSVLFENEVSFTLRMARKEQRITRSFAFAKRIRGGHSPPIVYKLPA